MRSESEVQFIRVKNNVAQRTVVSDWHAIVPGLGSLTVPPGTACGVGLSGSRQWMSWTGLRSIDGPKCPECLGIATAWVDEIDPSPGPRTPDEPDIELAPPGSTREAYRPG